jgi:addiction module RelE/StbE family toxin
MKLVWDLDAMVDRDDIFSYIERDDPTAAIRLDDTVEEHGRALRDFPQLGRAGREPGTREWVVSGTPYILVYEVSDDVVRVVRVLHGAMEWPPPR